MVGATGNRTQSLLGVYLNDHLAGATTGVDLARRTARAHRGSPAGEALRLVATEIAEDRATLLEIMRALGVPVRRYKVVGGWVVEKISRLKSNRRLFSRSPLSSLIELETLRIGVEGKRAGWSALRTVATQFGPLDADQLDRLVARAEQQAATVERLRLRAAAEALPA